MREVSINVQRDSVCMGDDYNAPHTVNFSMFDDKSLKDVFNYLAKHGYLAKIAGKHHSWSCLVNGKVIAKFKGNNNIPEYDSSHNNPILELATNGRINAKFVYNSAAT
ncbi:MULTISPECIES: hypothetical protein [Pseudoalteromonas]|jgi:hypothetical protein|uniref:hypothetical protein n=1 Tax=Pseudoalteromonas TaxID=53246 RepID=UPI001FB46EBB|nr:MULTISPECIES: hypothetical protein [Pseudoalteromonas]UOB75556.1 hypothetical protein MTP24_16620 [Pseudoalteromonas sp. APM04]